MTSSLAIQPILPETAESQEEFREVPLSTNYFIEDLFGAGYEAASAPYGYKPGSAWHIIDIEYVSERTVKARLQQEIYRARFSNLRREAKPLLAQNHRQHHFALLIARVAISIVHGLSYVGVVWGGFWLYQAFGNQQVEFYMPAFLLIVFSIVTNLVSAKILHSPEIARLKGATISKGEHFAVIDR